MSVFPQKTISRNQEVTNIPRIFLPSNVTTKNDVTTADLESIQIIMTIKKDIYIVIIYYEEYLLQYIPGL